MWIMVPLVLAGVFIRFLLLFLRNAQLANDKWDRDSSRAMEADTERLMYRLEGQYPVKRYNNLRKEGKV